MPMAYVLSSNNPSNTQSLFKFDPLNFRNSPQWTFKITYTQHLGLIFGRNEGLLYSYTVYNGYGVISLLDVNGNSKWYLSLPNRPSPYNT